MLHTRHGIDLEELQDLIKGKIKARKCPDCDVNGIQYWDGATGEGVNNTPSGIDSKNLESCSCETCYGLGYILYRN